MITVWIFLATFALGFQSRNVNTGQYGAAAITSFFIGGTHLVLYKALPDGGLLACSAYLIAGPLGITASMWAHNRFMTPQTTLGDIATDAQEG